MVVASAIRTGPVMRQVVGFADLSTERGTFGSAFWHAIVSNGDFTAYVCDSAATRPSSRITLGTLVTVIILLPINVPGCRKSGRVFRRLDHCLYEGALSKI